MDSEMFRSPEERNILKEYLNRRLKRFVALEIKCIGSEVMFCDVVTCLLIDKMNILTPQYFVTPCVGDSKKFYKSIDRMIRKVNRKHGV